MEDLVIIAIVLIVLGLLAAIAAAVLWRNRPKAGIALVILCGLLAVGTGLLVWAQYSASSTFALGEKALAKRSWARAIKDFESVSMKYPYSNWSEKSDIRANDARIQWAKSFPVEELDRISELLDYVIKNGTTKQKSAAAYIASETRIQWAKSLPFEELDRISELLDYVMKNGTTKQKSDAEDIANIQAARLMDATHKNIETFNGLEDEVGRLFDALNTISPPPGGLQRGLAICQEIEDKKSQQGNELLNAIEQFRKGIKLNISSDFKEYFQLMIDYNEKNIEANEAMLKMTQYAREMILASISGSSSLVGTKGNQAGLMEKQYDTLVAEADEIRKEADTLFNENILNELNSR